MIDFYATTTLPWKKVSGVNEYNEPSYLSSTIRARVDFGRRMMRTPTNEKVISMATIHTKTQVGVNDILTIDGTDWTVKTSDPIYDLAGMVQFYEVSV